MTPISHFFHVFSLLTLLSMFFFAYLIGGVDLRKIFRE